MKYIPLYVKTSYHFLNSMCDIKKLIFKCKQLGIKSIAITDTNMYGVLEFYKECNKENIKPIIGIEFIVQDKLVLLYAKNYDGYKELCELVYKRERDNLEFKKSSNIICIVTDKELYKEFINIYEDIFLGYFSDYERNEYIEITNNIVFINEVLCLEKDDVKYLKYLKLIENNDSISNIENIYINPNCYLEYNMDKDYYNMEKISKMCNITFPFNKDLLPKYKDVDNTEVFLFALCKKGLSKRLNGKITEEYRDRLIYELNIIKDMGFIDYFLVVYDFIKYARKNNFLVGPGRGSAAGSLVSYSLGITEVDPIKYNLLFERFLNPNRSTMPDIDIDFDAKVRNNVINYVMNKYGKNNVLPIITFSTFGGKRIIRDLGKVFGINSRDLDYISKHIKSNMDLETAIKNKDLKLFINRNNYNDFYNICNKLEGLKRQLSVHASGIIISNKNLESYIPFKKYEDYYLSGFSFEHLEQLGLLKIDFLGLKNLTLIKSMLNKIDIDYDNLTLDDKDTFNVFKEGRTLGIFQFESNIMKETLIELKPDCFDDIVAAMALVRPGPFNNIKAYIKRKHNIEKVEYIDKSLKDILYSTYGVIVYQEQIMQILNKMAGYSLAEADLFRRAISKKNNELIIEEENRFIKGCIENGYSIEKAKEVYDLVLKFANYGFNKSHSVAYSMISYKMAYIKNHYPSIFISTMLTDSLGELEKTKEYIREAKEFGINILHPSINNSNYEYIYDNNSIRLSFGIIKGLSKNIIDIILKERKNRKFLDFFNFVKRTYNKGINKDILEVLIYSDCFNEFGYNKKTLIENIDKAINYANLCNELDCTNVEVPYIEEIKDYDEKILTQKELEYYGFHIFYNLLDDLRLKYKDLILSKDLKTYFDKNIKLLLIVKRTNEIITKTNKKMLFIDGYDEYGNIDLIIFPSEYDKVSNINSNDIILVHGKVEKRLNKYQVIVRKVETLS